MRIAITGGIACGKSLLSKYLNELGVETIDADDVVHELVPAEERRRLAAVVFNDVAARRALEARLHPLVKARIREFLDAGEESVVRLAVIPLLFEVQWDVDFDIIVCVVTDRESQISRMVTTRGYMREEALSRLAAQMPVAEKAARSRYVIENNGTPEELKKKASQFVSWLHSLNK